LSPPVACRLGRPPRFPTIKDVTHNITKAMRLNPDIVLINFPANDIVAGFQ
jgi:hypothetical protein